MTREIKFRCWVDNKMYKPFTLLEGLNDKNSEFDFKPKAIFMQYTGLKDKNGKEIYEGDVIAFNTKNVFHYLEREWDEPADGIWVEKKEGINTHLTGTEKVIWGRKCKVVEWQDELTGFFPFADSPDNCGHCGGGYKANDFEVVGNIYENPDLLTIKE